MGRTGRLRDGRKSTVKALTNKQRQCIQGILDLKSAKEIARDLGTSRHAVEQHLKAVRKKFNTTDSFEAARRFAAQERASDSSYYDESDVQSNHVQQLQDHRLRNGHDRPSRMLRDSVFETRGAAYGHSSVKTIGLIILASVGLVATLALLVAIAEGVKLLTS